MSKVTPADRMGGADVAARPDALEKFDSDEERRSGPMLAMVPAVANALEGLKTLTSDPEYKVRVTFDAGRMQALGRAWARASGEIGQIAAAFHRADCGQQPNFGTLGIRPISLGRTPLHVQAVIRRAREKHSSPLSLRFGGSEQSDYINALDRLSDPGRTILSFADDGKDSRIIEAHGDLNSAKNIVVYIPGADTDLLNYDKNVKDRTLKMMAAAGPGTAGISWLGYDAPGNNKVFGRTADRAVGPFAAYVTKLARDHPGATITVVGHSYGTVVAGRAIEQGSLAAPNIRSFVAVGSPGWSGGISRRALNRIALVKPLPVGRLAAGIKALSPAGSDDSPIRTIEIEGRKDLVPKPDWHGGTPVDSHYDVPGGHSGAFDDGNPGLPLIGDVIAGRRQ